jgi:hypothetical protein
MFQAASIQPRIDAQESRAEIPIFCPAKPGSPAIGSVSTVELSQASCLIPCHQAVFENLMHLHMFCNQCGAA